MAADHQGSLFLFPEIEPPGGGSGRELEGRLREQGFSRIAGVDEVGRGPLAGPVVAAAVILGDAIDYPGVWDSKQLTEGEREKAFRCILTRAQAVGLGVVNALEIDRTNILRAALAAMVQALSGLEQVPDYVLVDGVIRLPLRVAQTAVPQGDSRCLPIGAASIVAKVVRDRLMIAYDQLYPQYGFASHKGYGTKKHYEALDRYGPCPLHRLTFRGVRREGASC